MPPVLLLLTGLSVVLVLGSFKYTKDFKRQLSRRLPNTQLLPKVVRVALIAAQCSELLKMIEQTSVLHLVAALLLLAVVVGARSETLAGED